MMFSRHLLPSLVKKLHPHLPGARRTAVGAAHCSGYLATFLDHAGAEVDLLLVWPGGDIWAIEIKRRLTPKIERGFHAACDDLHPARKLVVYPGQEAYPLAADINVLPLFELCQQLAKLPGV